MIVNRDVWQDLRGNVDKEILGRGNVEMVQLSDVPYQQAGLENCMYATLGFF